MFIYRQLYQNLMVTANQKSIIDIHTTKKTESKHNTKESSDHKKREQKRKGRKKYLQKQNQNN